MGRTKNCIEVAKNTEVNRHYNLTIADANELFETYGQDESRLIYQAFKYGYAQGCKATKAEMKKEAIQCGAKNLKMENINSGIATPTR